MKWFLTLIFAISCHGAGLLSMPGTLENITPSPIRGLVAFWNFDNSGSLSNDVAYSSFTTLTTGSGTNHLTMVGTVGTEAGIVGNASSHTNNVANYWRIASASAARLCQESSNYLSTVAWVNTKSNNATYGITGKGRSSTSGINTYALYISTTPKVAVRQGNGTTSFVVNEINTSPSNNWNMVALTFDGVLQQRSLWKNLEVTNAASTTTTNYASTENFNIGAIASTTANTLGGNVDEVAIWSGSRGGLSPTLTQAEINFLYNGGRGRKFPFNSGSGP